MDAVLILREVKVENANAISGLTWGFPAISNFLGFTHALSRKLSKEYKFKFTGCAVVSHRHQVQAYRPNRKSDYVFALTRNPLTKEGETASFVEEGRMHMTVSLVIRCVGEVDGEDANLRNFIRSLVFSQRLAGGTIVGFKAIELLNYPDSEADEEKFEREQLRKLLPGFALVLRSDLLNQHFRELAAAGGETEILDALLDFSSLKSGAKIPDGEPHLDSEVEWEYVPKPSGGWLVPINIGFRAISKLFEPGEVARSRDSLTSCRFVEAVHSLGQWISPHRAQRLEALIWEHHAEPENGWYLCRNGFASEST